MMPQNTSPAVMAQLHDRSDHLQDYPTPPWATRALCEMLVHNGLSLSRKRVWEPAANRGFMVRPLAEYFETVFGSDVHDYGCGYQTRDFLLPYVDEVPRWDWVATNPPYRLGLDFALRALDVATDGVALFMRTQWVEGEDRHRRLFGRRPPAAIWQFTERVPLLKGRCVRSGTRYDGLNAGGEPVEKTASTATAYAWFVWLPREYRGQPTAFGWIPPCRRELERPGDYDERGLT